MNSKNKSLYKNTAIFTVSGFLPRILSIFVLPIYTLVISTSEMGTAELLISTAYLLAPILTLNIEDAVIRYSADSKNPPKDYLSIGIKIAVISGAFLSLVSFFLYKLNFLKMDGINYIFLCGNYVFFLFGDIFSGFCRAVDKVKSVFIGNIVMSLSTIASALILMLCFNLGFKGYLIGILIGQFSFPAYLFFVEKLYKFYKFKVSQKTLKMMITFSFPLVFNGVAWWVNSASDRYIVAIISGVSAAGIYAMSYKIPNQILTLQTAFLQSWSISAIKEYDKNDTDSFISNAYTSLSGVMFIVSSGLILLNNPLCKLLFAKDFYNAWKFVPPILLAFTFNAKIKFFGSVLSAAEDTKGIATSTVIGAVSNIVGNVLLILLFGPFGAAVSTAVSYIITFFFRMKSVKNHLVLRYNKKREILSTSLLTIQIILAYFGFKLLVFEIPVFVVLLIIYRNEITAFIKILLNKVKKPKTQKRD